MRADDTNLLVRLIAQDDAEQLAVAENFIARGAWIPVLTLAETVWVLASVYDRGPKQIAAAVRIILEHEHLTVQDPDVVLSALQIFESRPTLGFTDCLVVEVARKAGHLPLGTVDRNLGKVDGAERD